MTQDHIDILSQLRRLRPTDSHTEFSPQTIGNWYAARDFVLGAAEPLDGSRGIGPSSERHVHAVLDGTSDLMLCVARQIALTAHYPNFNETTGANRSVITIAYNGRETADITRLITREEYLCNLPLLCRRVMKTWDGDAESMVSSANDDSFIDIEIELVDTGNADRGAYMEWKRRQCDCIAITEDDVKRHADSHADDMTHTIDINNARRANMVYHVGADIDNLTADDPTTAERYDRALQYFCYHLGHQATRNAWNTFFRHDNGEPTPYAENQQAVRNIMSNVCCADCFEARLRSVTDTDDIYGALTDKYNKVNTAVRRNLKALVASEHARWNVEKLIFGFMPLSARDRLKDECLFGEERQAWRKQMKKRGVHIDLCSFRDLKRQNPGDIKYDCLLVLAIPRILLIGK